MSKSDKLPAIQFYPGDWRKDPGVQALDYWDRGVWLEMLMIMHGSDPRGYLMLNGKAMTNQAIARTLGLNLVNQNPTTQVNQNLSRDLTTTLTTLLDYGVASRDEETGAIYSRRMVRDENLRNVRKNAGKLGGNPILVNQNPTTLDKQNSTTRVKQIPTPSVSSSFSSSEIKNTPQRAGEESDDLPGNEEPRRPLGAGYNDLINMTEEEAVAQADSMLVPAEFARAEFNTVMGREGKTWNGVRITSWRHYVKGEWEWSQRKEKNASKSNVGANGRIPYRASQPKSNEIDWSKTDF